MRGLTVTPVTSRHARPVRGHLAGMTNIVILGAGYAGLAAAVQLAARTRRDDPVRVPLVDAGDRFTERLRLPLTATGQDVADLRIPGLLAGTGARFEPGWVTSV